MTKAKPARETSGAGPMVWVPPVLDIVGVDGIAVEYKLNKLGLVQIGYLAKIYSAFQSMADRATMLGAVSDPTLLGTFLIDAIAIAFDEVVGLLASIIGLDPGVSDKRMAMLREEHDRRNAQRIEREEDPFPWKPLASNEGTIRDANTFPLDALVDLIEAVVTHDDVVNFFGKFKKMVKGPALKKLIKDLKKQ